MARTIDVVVGGGGYAGVIAANRLMTDPNVTVTLINPRPSFVERIRLHQRTVGTHDAVADLAEVLSPDVHLAVDAVTRVATGYGRGTAGRPEGASPVLERHGGGPRGARP